MLCNCCSISGMLLMVEDSLLWLGSFNWLLVSVKFRTALSTIFVAITSTVIDRPILYIRVMKHELFFLMFISRQQSFEIIFDSQNLSVGDFLFSFTSLYSFYFFLSSYQRPQWKRLATSGEFLRAFMRETFGHPWIFRVQCWDMIVSVQRWAKQRHRWSKLWTWIWFQIRWGLDCVRDERSRGGTWRWGVWPFRRVRWYQEHQSEYWSPDWFPQGFFLSVCIYSFLQFQFCCFVVYSLLVFNSFHISEWTAC